MSVVLTIDNILDHDTNDMRIKFAMKRRHMVVFKIGFNRFQISIYEACGIS